MGGGPSRGEVNALKDSWQQQTKQNEKQFAESMQQQARLLELHAEERRDAQKLHALQLQEEAEKQRLVMQEMHKIHTQRLQEESEKQRKWMQDAQKVHTQQLQEESQKQRVLIEEAHKTHTRQLQEESEKQRALIQDIMKQQSASMKDMMEAHREALAGMDERSQAQMQEMFKIIVDLVAALKEKNARAEQLTKSFTDVMDPPTPFEIRAAMQRIGYEENCLNIAIAGCSGVGKSSFLNALLGRRNNDPQAAKTGHTETTKEITKYKSRIAGIDIACFDIPGAGTINFSRYEYFKNQGLYVMDALVILYSDRLTDTDMDLMTNCLALKVPYFLVRTKCDNYFDDSNRDDEIRLDFDRENFQTDEMRQRFEVKKAAFRQRILDDAHDHILKAHEKMQETPPSDLTRYVYLVNRESLQKFVSQGKTDAYTMDEERLLLEVAQTVANRGL